METNPYREYLLEFTDYLINLAYKAKDEAEVARFDFERGKLFAYADLLDWMKRQTIFSDVEEKDIGLDKIRPLQEFLGIRD